MISWIQRTFQQHLRAVFAVLLGVIIISFVFTIGAQGGASSDARALVDRPFFGYNLGLQRDVEKLMGDGQISYQLNPSYEYRSLETYALARGAALHLADQWGIPAASRTEIEAQVKTLRAFQGQDGQFDAKAYQTFRDNLKTNPRGMTEGDIARVVAADVRADKVRKLLGGPGYVLPSDIKTQLTEADTTWTLATATAKYDDFKPEIKPSDAELTTYFEQAGARYDVSPRVVVSAVEFPTANYAKQVAVTEADVRAYYDRNPSRFPKPATPPPLVAAPAGDDFTAVRAKVEEALKSERAAQLAIKAASDFSLAIFESKATTAEAVEKFIASKGLTLKTLPPFARDAAPAELGGSMQAAQEAFKLTKDRPVSDALAVPAGAVILVWKETQPSRKPLFAEVRERVSTDYVENEKRKRFVELGRTVKSEIEARLKAGDAFDKAVAAASSKAGIKLETKTIAPFTLRTPAADLDRGIFGALQRLEKGQVSDMTSGGDTGIFVYAADKKAPDTTEANPKYVEARTELATQTANYAAFSYLSELVEKELAKSEPKAPAAAPAAKEEPKKS